MGLEILKELLVPPGHFEKDILVYKRWDCNLNNEEKNALIRYRLERSGEAFKASVIL